MDLKLDFQKLLKPYEQGGTDDAPVKRTLSTIASKLVYSNRIAPEVVGAAMLKVFTKMAHEGLKFSGDGTYGSPGRELFSCIKAQAIDLAQRKAAEDTVNSIMSDLACCEMGCKRRSKVLEEKGKMKRLWAFLNRSRGLWGV